MLFIRSLIIIAIPFIGMAQVTYPDKVNPHGSEECHYCHETSVKPSGDTFILRSCNDCHNPKTLDRMIHPLFRLNPAADEIYIPPDFDTVNDSVVCITCHEITCGSVKQNPLLLRRAPFNRSIDFCYFCHDNLIYQAVNPHTARTAGTQDEAICLYCHIKIPSEDDHPIISQAMHLDMTATCNKCHALHHHEEEHQNRDISTSKKASLRQLHKTERKYKISFPLKNGSVVQCNTCHSPHGKGLKPYNRNVFIKDGIPPHLLRLPRSKICYTCHDL